MEDLLHMSFQLPPYQELNDIYNGKRKAGFSSPDIDYYRLQYLKRYRFSIVKPKEKCECDTCEVISFSFSFNSCRDWINVHTTILNFLHMRKIILIFVVCCFL